MPASCQRPITGVWPLQSGKLILQLEQKLAVAALYILCTLPKKSSSFKNTRLLIIELTKNCKLKILPAYFVTTYISVFLHFLLFTLFLTQKSKLTPEAAGRIFQFQLMYNLELPSQNKQNLSENTTLERYCDVNRDCNINRL